MRIFLMHRFTIGAFVATAMACLTVPTTAFAQRLSVGAGAGIAASTDGTLSDGRTGPIVTAQATTGGNVGVGLEADGWWRNSSNILIGTAHVQFHVPSTPLLFTLGAGVGRGDPDGLGTINGTAGHVGAAIDIGRHTSSVALTLFANGFLIYSSSRSAQMVNAGLAITRR